LEPFVKARLTTGASATTMNRSLEVVRTILNRAGAAKRASRNQFKMSL
jgi:hypothetical protein